jgi:hypothetical protein
MFTCLHCFRQTGNLSIPGIIRSGLCFTEPLIPADLPASHAKATIYNSKQKALQDDPVFQADCKQKHVGLIYNHQHKEYIKLMSILESLPEEYYEACINLPFHEYTGASTPINALNKEAEALLWHQRLIHCGPHSLKDIHNHVDGVPDLSSFKFNDLLKCPTCLKTNLTKSAAGKKSLCDTVTCPYQGLYIDFAISGKISRDKNGKIIESSRVDVEGINGETSWVLIADAFSRMLHGDVRLSKASPVKYFESFLSEYSPNVHGKWVVMDQGGELYNDLLVRNVFKKYNYTIYPTGADNSSQNGPVERSHRTVSQGVKAILIGAGLDIKFWPLAFNHILRIRNAIPGQGQLESPLKMSTGSKENLKNLRVFGSCVWVHPPGIQACCFKDKARKGIFLGYVPHTTCNII